MPFNQLSESKILNMSIPLFEDSLINSLITLSG